MYHRDVLDRLDAGTDGGPIEDAGPDAAADAGTDAGPICTPRREVPRPARADGDGTDLVFALRNVVLDQREGRWQEVALDLDETCTTNETPTATCTPRDGSGPRPDGIDGVDNAFGAELLTALAEANPDSESEARASQDRGEAAVVLSIAGWNGEDDDRSVRAYVAQSVYATPSGGVRGDALAWDGTDEWFVSDADFLDRDPTQPWIEDDFAYVSGRVLVMRIPNGRSIYFPWSGNRMQLTLTDGILTGRISADATTITNVIIAGRWSVLDLGMALTSMGVCPGTDERVIADQLIEDAADIRGDPDTDGMGATCDALSVAVGLDGTRALLGGVVPVETLPPPCP